MALIGQLVTESPGAPAALMAPTVLLGLGRGWGKPPTVLERGFDSESRITNDPAQASCHPMVTSLDGVGPVPTWHSTRRYQKGPLNCPNHRSGPDPGAIQDPGTQDPGAIQDHGPQR